MKFCDNPGCACHIDCDERHNLMIYPSGDKSIEVKRFIVENPDTKNKISLCSVCIGVAQLINQLAKTNT